MKQKSSVAPLQASLRLLAKESPHILGLRFSSFRNFEVDAEIHFDFPITVLLGKNGTNKSSLLHALYGAPRGLTTAEFWFETSLDGIPREDEKGRKPSVVHWYLDRSGERVTCIKARAPRGAKDPDYWESVKPTTVYGFPSDAARGEPIRLHVEHLDFRGLLPAFDKYFYFPDHKHLSRLNVNAKRAERLRRDYRVQDYLRSRTRGLRRQILENGVRLTERELGVLSYVLERDYTKGTLLEHDRFRHPGATLLFETARLRQGYSEAFAGSGESAAAMLIHRVQAAPRGSLILLDEPETSLHPRAQQRIMEFLAESAHRQKLQIVIATHSAALASALPLSAVRVLRENASGKISIEENITAREALHDIVDIPRGRTILVEDERAKTIVLAELKALGGHAAKEYHVLVRGGGTSRIYEDIRAHATAERQEMLVVFDGDQRPTEEIPPDDALPSGMTKRVKLIKKLTRGPNPDGPELKLVDANDALAYIRFLRSRVFYLPANTPEELVWSDEEAAHLLGMPVPAHIKSETSFKEKIRRLSEEVPPYDEKHVFTTLLASFMKRSPPERERLREMLAAIRRMS